MKFHIISALLAIAFVQSHQVVASGINGTTVTKVVPENTNTTSDSIEINSDTITDVNPTTLADDAPTTDKPAKSTTVQTTTTAAPVTSTITPPTPTPKTTVPPVSTTETPKVETTVTSAPIQPSSTANPHARGRKFDGPSFFGGIILASGLTAIGFIAFKFYKARTELNYHTL